MRISLTTRDYDAAKGELETKATSLFPKWVKFNLANIGTVFLRLFAMLIDQCSWMLNRVVRQVWLSTVDTRRNAQHVLSRSGYELAGRAAASVTLRFSFLGGGTHGQDVTIPAGTVVETVDGAYHFETTAAGTITAGNAFEDIDAANQTARTEEVECDGSADQEKRLTQASVIPASVAFALGGAWTEQDDLLDSGAADKHFHVEYDDRLRAVLIFGDGTNGDMPSGTATVDYDTGGGATANDLGAATLTSLKGTFVDALAQPVDLVVTNSGSPSGGEDEQSIDSARKVAPKTIRAGGLTITREDHQWHAQEVPGVARCLALGHQEEGGIALGLMYLWIVPVGGGAPTPQLKQDVEDYLTDPVNGKPIVSGESLNLLDGEYVTITIVATVAEKAGFSKAAVKTAVDAALGSAVDPLGYFDYEKIDAANNYTMQFGYDNGLLYLSALYDVIMGTEISGLPCVKNVNFVTVNGVAPANVVISSHKIPALGSLAGITVP